MTIPSSLTAKNAPIAVKYEKPLSVNSRKAVLYSGDKVLGKVKLCVIKHSIKHLLK